MGTQPAVNLRRQGVHGTKLYDQAGRVMYSTDVEQVALSTPPAGPGALFAWDGAAWGPLALPTIAGQRLKWNGSALVWTEPEGHQLVTGDVTHTPSNTTLSDVTGLLVPIGASATEIWAVRAVLEVTAANVNVDLKLGWTVPAAATMRWGLGASISQVGYSVTNSTGGAPATLLTESGVQVVSTANVTFGVLLVGKIYGGGTGGNVQLQFAQNASDASNLTVLKGSHVEYRRLQG